MNFRGQEKINEKQGVDNIVFNSFTPHSGNWLPRKEGCFNETKHLDTSFDKRVNTLDKDGVYMQVNLPTQKNGLPAGIRVPKSFKLT